MNTTLDKSLFSENPLQNTVFPFLALSVENKKCFPKRFGFQVMHWHNDIQFILVLRGVVHIQTLTSECDISSGYGVFINKRLLHRITEKENCKYSSFIFPDTLISMENEMLTQQFVTTYTENPDLEIYIMEPKTFTINCLKKLYKLVFNKIHDKFYEFEVISSIYSLWTELIKSLDITPKQISVSDKKKQERLSAFLSYIHNHYSEHISLSDICNSCHVSESESLRIFKTILQTTPYEYLINFRIKKSIDLLTTTDYSVSEIAFMVGYNSQSQFGKYFKKRIQMSPSQYRKNCIL